MGVQSNAATALSARGQRYDQLRAHRNSAVRVAAFQKLCKIKARKYRAMGLATLRDQPERLVNTIFDEINNNYGSMMCVMSDSVHKFKTPEDLLRRALTVQQTREDATVTVELGEFVLEMLEDWTRLMERSKHLLRTTEKCVHFQQQFKAWAQSLFKYTRGCHRLRFIAACRRKADVASSRPDVDFDIHYYQ